MKKAMSILLSLILVLSLVACSSDSEEKLTGEAEGYNGKITATVTKKDGKITDLVVDAPGETKEIGGEAIKEITKRILETGSTENVEAVSGATITSDAVLKAVNSAK